VSDPVATPAELPRLHIPDEPVERKRQWLEALHGGAELRDVLGRSDGFAAWLWHRWRSLASAGVSEEDVAAAVDGYRREVWLWLAGERTWAQCCSGLAGRIARRARP
jgi:hypothetical protein